MRPALVSLVFAAVTFAQFPTIHARVAHTFKAHSAPLRQVAFSPDSQLLATSSADKTVKLWRVSDRKLVRTLTHPAGITSIAFSPDGQWLVTGCYDATVRVWRVAPPTSAALVRTLSGHQGTVWSVAVSPDGQRIASSGEDKTVRVWRLRDGAPLQTLSGHTLNVWSVAFSRDGRHLASGSFDKTVRLWRADTGALVRTMSGHKQAIVGVAFHPNSQLIASGGDDSTIRLWRVGDGALVKTLTGSDHVYSVAFSSDGQWLASGGREKGAIGTLWKRIVGERLRPAKSPTVRLWRVRDGALMQALAEHSDDVRFVALSADGRWLATSSEDRTVKLWRLGR